MKDDFSPLELGMTKLDIVDCMMEEWLAGLTYQKRRVLNEHYY